MLFLDVVLLDVLMFPSTYSQESQSLSRDRSHHLLQKNKTYCFGRNVEGSGANVVTTPVSGEVRKVLPRRRANTQTWKCGKCQKNQHCKTTDEETATAILTYRSERTRLVRLSGRIDAEERSKASEGLRAGS